MKETKHAAADPAARAAMHEVMAAFEAFKAGNDERLGALESKRADALLEEKVARIDASLQAAQGRMTGRSATAAARRWTVSAGLSCPTSARRPGTVISRPGRPR